MVEHLVVRLVPQHTRFRCDVRASVITSGNPYAAVRRSDYRCIGAGAVLRHCGEYVDLARHWVIKLWRRWMADARNATNEQHPSIACGHRSMFGPADVQPFWQEVERVGFGIKEFGRRVR